MLSLDDICFGYITLQQATHLCTVYQERRIDSMVVAISCISYFGVSKFVIRWTTGSLFIIASHNKQIWTNCYIIPTGNEQKGTDELDIDNTHLPRREQRKDHCLKR